MAIVNDASVNDILVNSKTLERLFGVSDRTVRDLTDKGIIKRDSHGKYRLMDSAKGYILVLKAANGAKKVAVEGEYMDLETEKAMNEHVKREMNELKLALMKGQVHKSEDVEAVMTDMFERFKAKITALPSKLARRLEGKDRRQITRVLKEEIDSALTELSEYSAADFYSDEKIEIGEDMFAELGVEDGEGE